ncbi:MAG: BrnT family toxin [Rhodanobacteraceae bacterium]|nr:MAG: BrnT family toxin [Rhodanobacteraceae bacterium]
MDHDPSKRRKNLRKCGIGVPDGMEALDGPMPTREDGREGYGAQQLASLGWAHGRVVAPVRTDREDGPRLISCREAGPYEREAHYQAYPRI